MSKILQKYLTNKLIPVYILIYGSLFFIPLFLHGSGLFGDSNAYYALYKTIDKGQFPYSSWYMPSMPFLLFLTSKISGIIDYRVYTIVNILLMATNLFYLIKIQSYFKSYLSKLFIVVFVYTNYILQLQYMAHADALALNLLLLLVLIILKFDFNKFSNFFLIGLLNAVLISVKYNYLVLVPVLTIWIFIQNPIKVSIKKFSYFIVVPVLYFIFWKYMNRKLIFYFEDNFNYDLFIAASKVNITDMGKFFAQHFLTKLLYRFSFLNVSVTGLIAYLSFIAFSIYLFFNFKAFKLKRLYLFVVLFVFIYPFAQMFILGKGGFIETNVRTLFPLFLIFPFLIAIILENVNKNIFLKSFLALYICYIAYLSINFLISTSKSPYYTSVNHVLDIKNRNARQFDFIKTHCDSAIFYTDEDNDARFYVGCNLKRLPNSIRLGKVGKRDFNANYNVADSIAIVQNTLKKSMFFLYHRNNTRDTLFKPIILNKGATKIIDEPGCEVYYLAK